MIDKCKICGFRATWVSNRHLETHGISREDYDKITRTKQDIKEMTMSPAFHLIERSEADVFATEQKQKAFFRRLKTNPLKRKGYVE